MQMADLKEILNDDERILNEDDLLQYINANTLPEEKRQMETIASDSFDSDALEGLLQLPHPEKVPSQVAFLKRQLHKQLRTRKKVDSKSPGGDAHFIILATIILLLTCILVFLVIKKLGI